MEYKILGNTGLKMSALSFGASALSGMFGEVDEKEAIKSVHAALDAGINYFDVAPAYGATQSETLLGKAIKDIPRDRYYLSTKVGKLVDASSNLLTFDYSNDGIRRSLNESAARLGTDYFDIVYLHDIEYNERQHTGSALTEGLDTLYDLKQEGSVGNVGFGFYPLDLWEDVLNYYHFDVGLVHNHYCLNDVTLLPLLPLARQRSIGVINASPFASGLLTDAGPPNWHPSSQHDRRIIKRVIDACNARGIHISKLALQFSSQHPCITSTVFSAANPETVWQNITWHQEPCDYELVEQVQAGLGKLMNKQWEYK